MCVGAYLGEQFARAVVEELHEKHRTCAPSYGTDLRPVYHHARRSPAAVRTRDFVTSVSWLVAFLIVRPPRWPGPCWPSSAVPCRTG
jgi:hypothetical protein